MNDWAKDERRIALEVSAKGKYTRDEHTVAIVKFGFSFSTKSQDARSANVLLAR